MYNKTTSKLITLMNKIYGNKKDITLAYARKKGLHSALKAIEKDIHRLAKKETSSLYKEMESEYISNYLEVANTTRKPIKKSKEKSKFQWSGKNAGQRIGIHSTHYLRDLSIGIENLLRKGKSHSDVIAFIVATGDKYSNRHAILKNTELWHIGREGHIDALRYNKVKYVLYVTKHDSKVCEECQHLEAYNDGIYTTEDAPVLPRHPHCRCILEPIEK